VLLEQIIVLLVDPSPSLVLAPLLPIELEILAPFYTISGALAHLISAPTWERSMVLDQT
jgi:hypothetical protein